MLFAIIITSICLSGVYLPSKWLDRLLLEACSTRTYSRAKKRWKYSFFPILGGLTMTYSDFARSSTISPIILDLASVAFSIGFFLIMVLGRLDVQDRGKATNLAKAKK